MALTMVVGRGCHGSDPDRSPVPHGIAVPPSSGTPLGRLEVQLGMPSQLHLAPEGRGKGAVPHRLDGKVLELVEQNLAVHHHKALDSVHLCTSVGLRVGALGLQQPHCSTKAKTFLQMSPFR